MFYAGDLNAGISHAISQRKVVACFISDAASPVCHVWEHEYLSTTVSACNSDGEVCYAPQPLGEVIGEKAVLLHIEKASAEAGFLSAFCAVDEAPLLVIIHNGRVLERLSKEVRREEFTERLLRALGMKINAEASGKAEGEEDGKGRGRGQVVEGGDEAVEVLPTAQAEADESATPTQSQVQAQRLLQERAQRLEAERQRRSAAAQADRAARATARRKESQDASKDPAKGKGKGKERADASSSDPEDRARQDWVQQQKHRNDQAQSDRVRILAQIAADRQERQARSSLRQDSPLQSPNPNLADEPLLRTSGAAATASPLYLSPSSSSDLCALHIRLFDGSSLRSRFPASSATLAKDVRSWIQESASEKTPFNFRQILAPKPSRSIEVSEEHRSLAELGLAPTATLVLVPVVGAASAYSGTAETAREGAWGYVDAVTSGVWGVLNGVRHYLPSFGRMYLDRMGDEGEQEKVEGARTAAVRAGREGDEGDEGKRTEFYNGNSLGFEARKDDEEGRT